MVNTIEVVYTYLCYNGSMYKKWYLWCIVVARSYGYSTIVNKNKYLGYLVIYVLHMIAKNIDYTW